MSTTESNVTPLHANGDGPTPEVEKPEEGIGALAEHARQAAEQRPEGEPARLDGEAGEETDAGKENLFNPERYDDPELQIAKVDGQTIDKIGLAFAGAIKLDRSSKDDCATFRHMKLGKDVTLKVTARVTGIATKGKDDADGNPGDTTETKTLSVHTIYPLSVED